ncbi:hypothetical protein IAU59_002519 [Kwoniella sp. CBS 9459]
MPGRRSRNSRSRHPSIPITRVTRHDPQESEPAWSASQTPAGGHSIGTSVPGTVPVAQTTGWYDNTALDDPTDVTDPGNYQGGSWAYQVQPYAPTPAPYHSGYDQPSNVTAGDQRAYEPFDPTGGPVQPLSSGNYNTESDRSYYNPPTNDPRPSNTEGSYQTTVYYNLFWDGRR